MAQEFVEGAERLPAGNDGGSHVTESRRVVWHTTEGLSWDVAISTLRQNNTEPHLLWEPTTGRIGQYFPASRAARALKNISGGVQTNRNGALQIEVLGFANKPFTNGPLLGLEKIMAWARANGVPDTWPMGPPPAYGPNGSPAFGINNGFRDKQVWLNEPGHFSHSQVPENSHGDCGAIDIELITGTKVADVPLTEEEWKKLFDGVREIVRKEGIMQAQYLAGKSNSVYNTGSVGEEPPKH